MAGLSLKARATLDRAAPAGASLVRDEFGRILYFEEALRAWRSRAGREAAAIHAKRRP